MRFGIAVFEIPAPLMRFIDKRKRKRKRKHCVGFFGSFFRFPFSVFVSYIYMDIGEGLS